MQPNMYPRPARDFDKRTWTGAAVAVVGAIGLIVPVVRSAPAPAAVVVESTGTAPAPVAVGGSLTLHGNRDGEQVTVTVLRVADPVRAADGVCGPGEGNRFVAVQLRIANTGTLVYDDLPDDGTALVDAGGERFDARFTATTAGPAFPGGGKIATGASAEGFVTFAVPANERIATVQFTMDSGFADETGEWELATS
ncbi:DUF4352 domain-containing protein [Dactylosporangium sp. CS-047395]|uniref:DUF4352 domain-containing protein n=1 Tax=Dactylosporangium sp. CS-047395 TaxID=3239936 RepID=UPI003D8E348A